MLALVALFSATAKADGLRVGVAKRDITGTVTGRQMMGYGDFNQKTSGIHTRLYSRAMVVEKTPVLAGDVPRVAIVVADLGMIMASVRNAVLAKLEALAPGRFSAQTVLLSATHTHSGPGGFSHYDLYNTTTQGFDPQTFQAIVDGITNSILAAEQSLQSGGLSWAEGQLRGVAVNRSLVAFELDKNKTFALDYTDPTHTVLRIDDAKGQPRGLFDWFAVHATSMSKHNHLISSDNKGVAAWMMERRMAAEGVPNFMAAFGNGNEGDSSPEIYRGQPEEKSLTDLQKNEMIGRMQFEASWELLQTVQPLEVDRLRARHAWIHMPGYEVSSLYTGSTAQRLCEPALGYSFAAGAEDGPSDIPGFYEGMKQGDPLPGPTLYTPILMGLRLVLGSTLTNDECQYPKPILFSKKNTNKELLPKTLAFQLITIGNLAFAAPPAELTTTSGRRLRRLLETKLAPQGIERVVLVGLSNDYGHYVTTPEEYQSQQYEGASTLFGPNTLPAYLQIFGNLADSLAEDGRAPASDGPAAPRQKPLVDLLPTWPMDGKFPTEKVGQVLDEPAPRYRGGETVVVSFRSSLPIGNQETFAVERWTGSAWERVVGDGAPETPWNWKRDGLPFCMGCSKLTAHWQIPASTSKGTYRIRHRGAWRATPRGTPKAYESSSPSFLVE